MAPATRVSENASELEGGSTERQGLTGLLLEKVTEQAERADHLIGLVPRDRLDWKPDAATSAFTLAQVLGHLLQCLAVLVDDDLTRVFPTVFVTPGEPVLTLMLGNLEHLINHKFQLFYYLKLMGLPVATADLYRLRGSAATP